MDRRRGAIGRPQGRASEPRRPWSTAQRARRGHAEPDDRAVRRPNVWSARRRTTLAMKAAARHGLEATNYGKTRSRGLRIRGDDGRGRECSVRFFRDIHGTESPRLPSTVFVDDDVRYE